LEGDLVAHCGNTTAGVYVNTLTVTDIATGWVENRAIWGKTAEAVIEALRDIKASLPFSLKSLDFDNGAEFLNKPVLRYFQKDDNAHVEQKNWMTARDALGFRRMENRQFLAGHRVSIA
jgi:IS30 family transposase